MKPGVNLWSRVLIYNRPTRERERERERELTIPGNAGSPRKPLLIACHPNNSSNAETDKITATYIFIISEKTSRSSQSSVIQATNLDLLDFDLNFAVTYSSINFNNVTGGSWMSIQP